MKEVVVISLETRSVDNVTIIDAKGEITIGEGSDGFREKIRGLIRGGKVLILLNMDGISYVDSTGIGELVSAHILVTNVGGQFKVLDFQKRIEDVLMMTKLYTVFEVWNDENAAIKSFNQ